MPAGSAMIYSIQCGAGTTTETIRAAVTRAPADEVALTFPLGIACGLASATELEALWAHCQALGKIVVVIGGDETLRACAVAAGFVAATSLEEWETTKHRAVRRHQRKQGPRDGKRLAEEPVAADMQVMHGKGRIAEENAGNLYDAVGDDPPRYVVDLIAADETRSPAALYGDAPTIPLQRSRITRRLEESRREAAAAAALDREQQEYEERVTHAIRTTSAVDDASASTADADLNGGEPPADGTDRTGS